jgi:hypothetical protein
MRAASAARVRAVPFLLASPWTPRWKPAPTRPRTSAPSSGRECYMLVMSRTGVPIAVLAIVVGACTSGSSDQPQGTLPPSVTCAAAGGCGSPVRTTPVPTSPTEATAEAGAAADAGNGGLSCRLGGSCSLTEPQLCMGTSLGARSARPTASLNAWMGPGRTRAPRICPRPAASAPRERIAVTPTSPTRAAPTIAMPGRGVELLSHVQLRRLGHSSGRLGCRCRS